jgi:hypothetical protein
MEVADIVRSHQADFLVQYGERLGTSERRVLNAIRSCRTSALGGHVHRCDRCGHQAISYNSCRNRHCPKCQASARAKWVEDQAEHLLPVEYFHVVFTLPREIGAIALRNKRLVYGLLFKAAAETLQQVANKHLGIDLGVLAVLHTWGQNLQHHPHVHCVVPGGGLSRDRSKWVSCRPGFLLPVRVLSRLFRGKFLAKLKEMRERDELVFSGALAEISTEPAFRAYLAPLYRRDWVVYSKRPFGGPERVLKYLARYTHRVAIANSRLISMDGDRVTFLWRDYTHGSRRRPMTLSAVEFLRRFLLHTLPQGFVRIRTYGFLANRVRAERLALCRTLIETPAAQPTETDPCAPDEAKCPSCRTGRMLIILAFETGEPVPDLPPLDSS